MELWHFQNVTYFLTSWPSYLTYILVQRTCRNHGLVLACDHVWWWLTELFLRFCESSVQTDRQTNGQTWPTNILAKMVILASKDGETDGWTDRQTARKTERQTERQTVPVIFLKENPFENVIWKILAIFFRTKYRLIWYLFFIKVYHQPKLKREIVHISKFQNKILHQSKKITSYILNFSEVLAGSQMQVKAVPNNFYNFISNPCTM